MLCYQIVNTIIQRELWRFPTGRAFATLPIAIGIKQWINP